MAQMVLGSIGEAIGENYGYGQIGGMIGSVAGTFVDNALFPDRQRRGRLDSPQILTSTEGAPIPRIDGTVRLSGQVIWATKFRESKKTAGGKGSGTVSTTYKYSLSFAVGLCRGVVRTLGRIWADGNLLDASKYTVRFYPGTEDQTPDSLIAEIEGADNAPAYRGLCYVVFEDMDVTGFGARIPQLQFEIARSVTAERDPHALENVVAAVNLIPGAGEFVYATTLVVAEDDGRTEPQNGANATASTYSDVLVSLDALQAVAPNLKSVSLVVGWFGDDLRAGVCTVRPKVDAAAKRTYGEYTDDDETKKTDYAWSVAGLKRGDAETVSFVDGFPAYGGTPSDRSVTQIVKELKARGWKVTFYPFVFMDIAAVNALNDPYSDHAASVGQPAYPWRGRIACSPAPGFAGSPDRSAAAGDQVSAFFAGTWGYNRMVLHYAKLCRDAGGVDAFLIGSELRGLTQTRSGPTSYPAVAQLQALAAQVRAILGTGCKIGYGADWSEWNAHQTGDAPGAVQFNLDPLWADSNVDFVGIDNYMPLSDWRDGTAHRDYDADKGITSIYDLDYLQANIAGGENFDWYYASDDDRQSQTRTPIADAASKPWVWRAKDLVGWWRNRHYDRVDGRESPTPTAWVPQSKPIRFTELGCPAVDKGANQPNVFYDPKSVESAFPYFSAGTRDDLIQRRFLEAHYAYWADAARNPISSVYGGSMLETDYIAAWCWDARPYPYFPGRADLWADAANYAFGHWLNGRLGAVQLGDLVTEICDEAGLAAVDASGLCGLVTGYAKTAAASARDELSELAQGFFFDAAETQGTLRFVMRGQAAAASLGVDDLVFGDDDPGCASIRTQDADLPVAYRISYVNAGNDYETGTYRAKRLAGAANRVEEVSLPLVMDRTQAGTVGDRLLQECWAGREAMRLTLPPSRLALDPTDVVAFDDGGATRTLRLDEIVDGEARTVSAVSTDPSVYGPCAAVSAAGQTTSAPANPGRAIVAFMDLPMLTASDTAYAPHLAGYGAPWTGVAVWRSAADANFALDVQIPEAADIGETLYDFYPGPGNRWDAVNTLYVRLYAGTLASADAIAVLGGANALALQNGTVWEIVQFRTATLIDTRQWKLEGLLRGQFGTEVNMGAPLAAGARVVVLDSRLVQSTIPAAQFAAPFHYRYGPVGKGISDASYQDAVLGFAGAGLRPYAPCHPTLIRSGSDLTLGWVRRDRNPQSDGLDASEIPLSEACEAYEVEVADAAGTVIRTVTGLAVSSWLYPAALQIADFGRILGAGDRIRIAVYQMSAVVGRGPACRATFAL